MIVKDKMYLIASNVDESIKLQTAVYDVTLFKSFLDFEQVINNTPVVLDTIIINSYDLAFNATNVQRLINLLNLPFIRVTGNIIYLLDDSYDLKLINEFLMNNSLTNWVVYKGDLSPKFIADIVSGAGRESNEAQIELVTYRMRLGEYIKQKNTLNYEDNSELYMTDEMLLSDIPDVEEPEDTSPAVDVEAIVNYVVGPNSMERTLMVFYLAQYFSMKNKTVIVEKDFEYHTLTEMITKCEMEYDFFTVEELFENVSKTINAIKASNHKLIVIGCRSRADFDYNFIMDILLSNLKHSVNRIIRECNYEETPYGNPYIIVTRNTVPDILRCCSELQYDIDQSKVFFVGLQIGSLGPISLRSNEMESIISKVLEKNDINSIVLKVNGITLKGESEVYDIFSIIERTDRR